jgi:hypothetical protein
VFGNLLFRMADGQTHLLAIGDNDEIKEAAYRSRA